MKKFYGIQRIEGLLNRILRLGKKAAKLAVLPLAFALGCAWQQSHGEPIGNEVLSVVLWGLFTGLVVFITAFLAVLFMRWKLLGEP